MINDIEMDVINCEKSRILIVDDDAMLRSLVCKKLERNGYQVIEAGNGCQAIEMFVQEHPDIILMDANMPDMNGFEATAYIKTLPNAASVPILMVSGLEDDLSVDKAFSVGASEYITKPICWPLLIHRLANISSAMATEAKIIQAKLDADRANHSKSEFLANMSHELRTPMHAILSFASMGVGKANSATPEKISHYFSRIDESGKRLLTLLNALLDLSKLEAGAVEMQMKKADLMEIVDCVHTEFSALISGQNTTLIVEKPTISTQAYFDTEKMIQVVRNLLSNALKFSPQGKSINLSFDLTSLVDQKYQLAIPALRLTVRDQGLGIPEHELEYVFNKFVQSSNTNTGAGGTGLGLAICKQIIESHHGIIYAKNNAGQGASFSVVIPVEKVQ